MTRSSPTATSPTSNAATTYSSPSRTPTRSGFATRIEAIFCCQFLALLLGALIEREIRAAMRNANTAHIPLYPELRACPSPSAQRILEIFADVTRHELNRNGHLVQTFEPDLSPLQQQVLGLLGVPTTSYTGPHPTP